MAKYVFFSVLNLLLFFSTNLKNKTAEISTVYDMTLTSWNLRGRISEFYSIY